MANSYLLGIDIGTTQCKSALFDLDGKLVSSASREYPTDRSHPGWAVQNPNEWWQAATSTIRNVTSGMDPEKVAGIGTTSTQEGVVAVDPGGNNLSNCMTWEDAQSVPEQYWIKDHIGDDMLLERTGTTSSFSGSAPRVLYIKKHSPDVYGRTHKFLAAKDYVNHKLTGVFATDWSNAGHTQLLDVAKRDWDAELMSDMGLSAEKWPNVLPSSEIIGRVTAEASATTGLVKGTAVVAGAGDQEACAVGLGASLGGLFEVAGSADMLCVPLEKPIFHPQIQCFCHPERSKWILASTSGVVGETLRWYRDNLGGTEVAEAIRLGITPYQVMDLEVERTPDLPSNTIFFPHLYGGLEGALFFNLTLGCTRGEFVRSMFEGSAYCVRFFMDMLKQDCSIDIKDVTVAGGVSRSKIWRQIRADVTRRPFTTTRVKEATAFGAALLAGVGSGAYRDFEEATRLVELEERTLPREEPSRNYDKIYKVFVKLRQITEMGEIDKLWINKTA